LAPFVSYSTTTITTTTIIIIIIIIIIITTTTIIIIIIIIIVIIIIIIIIIIITTTTTPPSLLLFSVKDVNQSLCDDGLVETEKIGAGNFYWSFVSQGSVAIKNKVDEAENAIKR